MITPGESDLKANAEAQVESCWEVGVSGVWFDKGKYKTRFMQNGERYYFGHYDTFADASSAVIAKRLELISYNEMSRQVDK